MAAAYDKRSQRGRKKTAAAGLSKPAKSSPRRRRFPPAERERMIVEAAIRFFAEEGFHGQTRALAARLGVTHSVLYRYFPTKEALIERVYREVYLRRWNPEWTDTITERSRPFSERLREFYIAYADAIFDPNWVRIFIFAGLRNVSITRTYYAHVRKNIVLPLCAELRAHSQLPAFDIIPLSEMEEELFWSLHGGIFFLAVRKFVYGVEVPSPLDPVVRAIVDQFLVGAITSIIPIIKSLSQPPRNSASNN